MTVRPSASCTSVAEHAVEQRDRGPPRRDGGRCGRPAVRTAARRTTRASSPRRPRKPGLEVGRLHHVDPADHARVLGAAILRTEEVVLAGLGRLEPERRVAPGQHVLLHAEGRHEEAVDHVLAGHHEADLAAHRHVQLVDLALAFHVLEAPHPLLAGDVDRQCVLGDRAACRSRGSAPQAKIPIERMKGITIQTASSLVELRTGSGTSSGSRRRYLSAKNSSSPAISTQKKTVNPTRKYQNASTPDANVEACSSLNQSAMVRPDLRDRPDAHSCARPAATGRSSRRSR